MPEFDIDAELMRHTTLGKIADAKKSLANQLVQSNKPFIRAKLYAGIGLVGETATHLLAYERVPGNLKFTLFMAALTEAVELDIQWGMNYAWLVPQEAQRSISRGLRTQQEITLLQLKKSVSALGLSA